MASAKINISYSILFNLTTSYSSYFGGKKRISRNKTSFFLLMHLSPSFRHSIRTSTQEQPYLILSIKAGHQTLSISIRSALKRLSAQEHTCSIQPIEASCQTLIESIKIDSKRY